VKGLKMGLIAHFYTDDMIAAPEQAGAIAQAADVLRRLGAEVRPIRLSPLQRWTECGRTILMSESYAVHERDLKERPQDYAEVTRRKLLPGAFIPAADYVKAQQLRTALCAEFAQAMRERDAVITLSSLDMPCRIDDAETIAKTYERQCRMPFNVTGTPAIAVPTGFTSAGMPTAMQIVSRAFAEPMVYRVAQAYCEATGFCDRHPPAKQVELRTGCQQRGPTTSSKPSCISRSVSTENGATETKARFFFFPCQIPCWQGIPRVGYLGLASRRVSAP
jgi:aspartyl-tRNA(Asn)/glutamyl-tRNA(Gln) amidotransferase subunit A